MHPGLEPILSETYGIMIYQEQVQQAAQRLAGYTLGGADILRRAMGKKIQAEMDAQRDTFVSGAAENDIDAKLSGEIFDQISAFAGYGFNKSHAAAYALIAWQTAWFKAHYPAEFMAASMTLDAGNTDKLAIFRQDCQARGITMLPPDVNASEARFVVEEHEDGLAIRYALGAIRNVGMEAMRQLVTIRKEGGEFTSLDDFAARLAGILGSRALENLIKAGALDRIAGNRAQLLAGMPAIIAHGSAIRKEKESAQENLFGGAVDAQLNIVLPDVPEAGSKIRLENEFAALGLYISAHPLDDYAERLVAMDITPSSRLEEVVQARGNGCRLRLAGVITGKQVRTSSRGNRFAFLQLTDQSGVFEVTVFSDLLALSREYLESEIPMLVKADARLEEGGVRLIGQQITPLDDIAFIDSGGLEVRITDAAALEGIRDGLRRDGTGTGRLKLSIRANQSDVVIDLPGRFRLSGEFRQMLKILPGVTAVRELS